MEPFNVCGAMTTDLNLPKTRFLETARDRWELGQKHPALLHSFCLDALVGRLATAHAIAQQCTPDEAVFFGQWWAQAVTGIPPGPCHQALFTALNKAVAYRLHHDEQKFIPASQLNLHQSVRAWCEAHAELTDMVARAIHNRAAFLASQ
jgi:hypothetical protein